MAQRPNNQMLPPGTRIARYEIIRKLASGGFGVVYLARREDGQPVALKEFLPQGIRCRPRGSGVVVRCSDPHDQSRFQDGMRAFFREADMLAAVHNDRVIPIWDVFQENGTAYFAMPVEKGGTLQDLVRRRGQALSEQEIAKLFVQAAQGVMALHDRGLLHLDIKPNNLWVRPDGSLLVLDLGASRWEDEQIRDAHLARTPGFAAPEQHGNAQGKKLTPATDVYGLSAALFACIAQSPPPPANRRVVGDRPTTLLYGRASPVLLDFIEQGLSMSSSRRPTLREFTSTLSKLPRLKETPQFWPIREMHDWPDAILNNQCP